jgi:hypothetical protein
MRFKKIVEELHIELVVFHDQDSFRHPATSPSTKRAGPARFKFFVPESLADAAMIAQSVCKLE